MNLQAAKRKFLFGELDELLLKSTEEYKTMLYHNQARITIQYKTLKARAAQHYSETIRRKTESLKWTQLLITMVYSSNKALAID